MRMNTYYLALILFLLQGILPASAQTPGNAYIIQEGDWLSKIARSAYNNPSAYKSIIQENNKKAAQDQSFATINNSNQLVAGQKIWLPIIAPAPSNKNIADVPKTNCEIRLWYNYQVVAIGVLAEKWKQDGLSLKERALKAYDRRHEARVHARFLMQNKAEVKDLEDRDREIYGNPDGPTFEYLVKKNTDKGLSLAQAYENIIQSSSKTDKKYNAECQ